MALLAQRMPGEAIKKFVGVLLQHSGRQAHQPIANKCLRETVNELGRTSTPDFPDILKQLSPDIMQKMLELFAERELWQHVEALMDFYGTKQLPRDFAKGLSLLALVCSKSFIITNSQRLKLMKLLQKYGAKLEKKHQAMHTALENNDTDLVHHLLDEGFHPSMLSVEQGDTPMHVAFHVDLDNDKGNFSLLERLLELYRTDPAKYHNLDPRGVDSRGDTLLHVACKCKYNKRSQKAIRFLVNQQLPADVQNKEGKTPVQCLTTYNDRRAQLLGDMSRKLPAAKPKAAEMVLPRLPTKMPTAPAEESWKKFTTTAKTKAPRMANRTIVSCSDSSLQNTSLDPDIGVKVTYLAGVDLSIERIKELLSERPDPDVSTYRKSKSGEVKVRAEALKLVEKLPEEELEEDTAEKKVEMEKEKKEFKDYANMCENLTWEVEFTADVTKCFRDRDVPTELKHKAIRQIQMLASGEWRPYLHKCVEKSIKLFETKLSKAARIIWQVAVTFSARCSEEADKSDGKEFAVKGGKIYSEVIRIWDIVLDHDNLHRSVQNITKSINKGKACFLKKKLNAYGVKDTQIKGKSETRSPILYTEQDDELGVKAVQDKQQMVLCPPASSNEKEYHILKFYYFSSSVVNVVLNNIKLNVEFPFNVTDTEYKIINLNSDAPILLLGRSGTGKTTCCLYRLWTSFIKYWVMAKETGEPFMPRADRFLEDQNADDADGRCQHLHQIFITKNPVLCTEVHKNFYGLCHAHVETKDHADKEGEDVPARLQDVDDFFYPLFLTSKQLLLMLDASLAHPHFFERNKDGSLARKVQGWDGEDDLFGFTLLEEDSDDDGNDEKRPKQDGGASRHKKVDPRREVTYQVFAEEVWPKILKKMPVKYHPSLVWTEIISFIKGSFEALSKEDGHLSLEEYNELGKRRAPNFTGERDKVYELYKRYDHFKKQKFLFDEADLIQNIYKRLHGRDRQMWVIHQLYVDEVQDFTQAELCVLLRLPQNPKDTFLAGDTAQGIVRGIAFRFSDLKSLFFYAQKIHLSKGHIQVPKIYQLMHNYRSHAGIISLASAVLDLMVEFFPESFDRLRKDQGLFKGPKPILLESCNFSDLSSLLQDKKKKTSHIEFGAHQAILVVNDAAKNSMPRELRNAIVLTIFEAKGLEFDDVLLYNFFKDSQASKEWRVVMSYLEKACDKDKMSENLVEIDEEIMQQTQRSRPLTFDANQHKILNSEIKQLYTALTRARVNVWIFDEDEEKRAPMFEYFKARKLVRCVNKGCPRAEDSDPDSIEDTTFAKKSTLAEWEKRGDEMMTRRLYEAASKCYKMADNETKELVAQAHDQAEKASRMKDNPKRKREEFIYAAEKFLESWDDRMENHDKKAALCLQYAKEYELAALVYDKCGMPVEAAKMHQRCKKHIH